MQFGQKWTKIPCCCNPFNWERHLPVLHAKILPALHARIRQNCSNLNNDLFNNHLLDNPLYSWSDGTEEGEHYFFPGNKYRNERHQFFEIPSARDFQPLTINKVLFGNETLDCQLNIELFSAVHEYIKSTKRFDNT